MHSAVLLAVALTLFALPGHAYIAEFAAQNWQIAATAANGTRLFDSQVNAVASPHFAGVVAATCGDFALRITAESDASAVLELHHSDADDSNSPALRATVSVSIARSVHVVTGHFQSDLLGSGIVTGTLLSRTEFALELRVSSGPSVFVVASGSYSPPPVSFWEQYKMPILTMGIMIPLKFFTSTLEAQQAKKRTVQQVVAQKGRK